MLVFAFLRQLLVAAVRANNCFYDHLEEMSPYWIIVELCVCVGTLSFGSTKGSRKVSCDMNRTLFVVGTWWRLDFEGKPSSSTCATANCFPSAQ